MTEAKKRKRDEKKVGEQMPGKTEKFIFLTP